MGLKKEWHTFLTFLIDCMATHEKIQNPMDDWAPSHPSMPCGLNWTDGQSINCCQVLGAKDIEGWSTTTLQCLQLSSACIHDCQLAAWYSKFRRGHCQISKFPTPRHGQREVWPRCCGKNWTLATTLRPSNSKWRSQCWVTVLWKEFLRNSYHNTVTLQLEVWQYPPSCAEFDLKESPSWATLRMLILKTAQMWKSELVGEPAIYRFLFWAVRLNWSWRGRHSEAGTRGVPESPQDRSKGPWSVFWQLWLVGRPTTQALRYWWHPPAQHSTVSQSPETKSLQLVFHLSCKDFVTEKSAPFSNFQQQWCIFGWIWKLNFWRGCLITIVWVIAFWRGCLLPKEDIPATIAWIQLKNSVVSSVPGSWSSSSGTPTTTEVATWIQGTHAGPRAIIAGVNLLDESLLAKCRVSFNWQAHLFKTAFCAALCHGYNWAIGCIQALRHDCQLDMCPVNHVVEPVGIGELCSCNCSLKFGQAN